MTVFVSYAGQDSDAVNKLAKDLQDAGEQVWIDRAPGGGEAWWRTILEQVRACDVFVFALSQNSIKAEPCRAALGYARALGLPILPVQIGPLDGMQLNPVAEGQALDFRDPTPASGMRVIAALNRARAQRQPLPSPLPAEPPMPFDVDSILGTLGVEPTTGGVESATFAADIASARVYQPTPPGGGPAAGSFQQSPPVSSPWQPGQAYGGPGLPPPGWQGATPQPFPPPASSRRKWVIVGAVVTLIAAAGIGAGLYLGLQKDSSSGGQSSSSGGQLSDEDQIREVVKETVSAFNDGDEARIKSLECAKDAKYGIWVNDQDREQRGTMTVQVNSVKIDGDHATAEVTGTSTDPNTHMNNEMHLVREGGSWKVCTS